jgi:hypothetical protein
MILKIEQNIMQTLTQDSDNCQQVTHLKYIFYDTLFCSPDQDK